MLQLVWASSVHAPQAADSPDASAQWLDYGTDDREIAFRFSAETHSVSFVQSLHTGPADHPAYCLTNIVDKEAPKCHS
jgi:hypothetical protein